MKNFLDMFSAVFRYVPIFYLIAHDADITLFIEIKIISSVSYNL